MSSPFETLPVLPPLGPEPLVSVLIVNYNYERYLGAAIESVLEQTYSRFEVVICDDGSQDGSRDVIRRYAAADPRIKFIFKENAAVAAALNDAYRASTGEIIALLDADDLFAKDKLARVVERFAAGGRIGMVMNVLTKVDSDGAAIGRIPQLGVLDRGELRRPVLQSAGNFAAAPASGISLRRECAERVFPIPEKEFRTEADGYLRAIAALFYAVDVIDEPLTMYRVHSSNVTASQTVDTRWCERVISANERIHDAVSAVAAKHGWPIEPLEMSFGYCEARAVHDYLRQTGRGRALQHIRRLNRAAAAVKTTDRLKTRAKATALSVAVLLPHALGKPIVDAIFLPGALKRLVSK